MGNDEDKPPKNEDGPPRDELGDDATLPLFPGDDAPPQPRRRASDLPAEPPPSLTAAPPERPVEIDADTPNQRLDRLAPRRKARRPFSLKRLIWGLFKWGIILGVIAPVALVTVYKWVPPPATFLMLQRAVEGKGLDYRWRPLSKISPNLVRSAIAAEDGKFCTHDGFDFEAIEKAVAHNKRRPSRPRGASTISQQTAKNVFLWPQRSWVRKGLEVYFTVLIETIWGKERIMEVYLNVAEMGPGTYGAQAAARRYFGVDARNLSPSQSARLVAILPNPLKYKAVKPGRYVQRRSRNIGGAAGTVRREGLASCIL